MHAARGNARACSPRTSATVCSRSDPILPTVWHAATTTPRDRKELLRALLEEVIVKVERDKAAAHLTLRWKGGALDEIDLALPRSRPATIRTDEDTIALVRRLAVHYPDTVIAGILNRQGRTTAYGHRFEGEPRRQSASPLGHPVLRGRAALHRGRAGVDQEGRGRARRRPFDFPPLAQRRHHPGRAADARRALAHSPDR